MPLEQWLASEGVTLEYPSDIDSRLAAIVPQHNTPYVSLDVAYQRMVTRFLVRISLVNFKPPTAASIVRRGAVNGELHIRQGVPQKGFMLTVTECMKVFVFQVCCYMDNVLKSFFEQAIDETLWITTKDKNSNYPLLNRSNEGIAMLREQLHHAARLFINLHIQQLQKEALDFQDLKALGHGKLVDELHTALDTMLKISVKGQSQSAKDEADAAARLDELKVKFVMPLADDAGVTPASGAPGSQDDLTPDQQLTYNWMHLCTTTQVAFIQQIKKILGDQMFFRSFNVPSDAQNALLHFFDNFLRGEVYTIKYRAVDSKCMPHLTGDSAVDSEISIVSYADATEAKQQNFFLQNQDAAKLQKKKNVLEKALHGIPQKW